MVADVLEHLDRQHSIEAARGSEAIDVGGYHVDVVQPELSAPRQDELALQFRVGDGEDPRARMALGDPDGEGTPATPEVQHVHAVG